MVEEKVVGHSAGSQASLTVTEGFRDGDYVRGSG